MSKTFQGAVLLGTILKDSITNPCCHESLATILKASKDDNQAAIAAYGVAEVSVDVAGAKIGDAVIVTSKTPTNGIVVSGYVSADDVVKVRYQNVTNASVDPAATTFAIVVVKLA
jgi:hypothetical protein